MKVKNRHAFTLWSDRDLPQRIPVSNRREIEKIAKLLNIPAYGACSSFNVIDWFDQLSYRSNLNYQLKFAIFGPVGADEIDALLREPLMRRDGIWKEQSRNVRATVRDASISDLQEFNSWLQIILGAESARPSKGHGVQSLHSGVLSRPEFTARTNVSIAPVAVNLYATDRQIRSDFKKWLALKRAEMPIEGPVLNNFSKANFADWCKHRVLLWLDIQAYLRSQGKRLSDETVGELMFPDEKNGDVREKVAKSVRPLAEHLIDTSVQFALHLEALEAWRTTSTGKRQGGKRGRI